MTTEQAQEIISLLVKIGGLLVILIVGKFLKFVFFDE